MRQVLRDPLVSGPHLCLRLLEHLPLELRRLLAALVEAMNDVRWPLEGRVRLGLDTTLSLIGALLRYASHLSSELLLCAVGRHSTRQVLILVGLMRCSLAKAVAWLDLLGGLLELLVRARQLLSLAELIRA